MNYEYLNINLFICSQYFDEHEEINDLLALSEVVPNIIEDKKVGWRMTSTNDECWRSDEHLLETKFRDACPAFVRLLSKQIYDKTQSTESLHAARVALAEEKDMGDEVGQEVGLEEVSSSKFDSEQERNGKDVHENKSNGSGIAIYNAEREDLKAPDVTDTPKTVEDEDEIEKLDGVQQERIEVPGSVENNSELKQCPTQDIEELECDEEGEDEIKNKEETTVDEKSEEVEESKAQFDDSTAPNDEAKAIMNSNLESSGRGVENTPTPRPEEDPAPPTIVTKMTLSLPSFKPATGCTNASDFIVRCFVARLRSGISVVKHGRSRWCKSRLRILHVHPDGSSLSWKPAIGEPTSSKRPPKLDLSNCLEIRHAWSSDPLHQNYTGTSILRSKCETINAHKVRRELLEWVLIQLSPSQIFAFIEFFAYLSAENS